MPDFRIVTEDFSVSPQLSLDDVSAAAAAGYRTIICNRPDGEDEANQPSAAAIREKAESLGLAFHDFPFSGGPSTEIVNAQAEQLRKAETPVLAYCGTGTRAILSWALSHGQEDLDAAIAAGTSAGYDLSTLLSYM